MAKSSRKRRIVAFLIDHFVITFLIVTILFLFFGEALINGNDPEQVIPILSSVLIPGFMLYFAKDSYQGISLGKWIMGIMVRDENHLSNAPSFGRLFLRNLFLIIWPIEFIILVTNGQKKRLGDIVAKAVVLKNPVTSSKGSRIMALISVVMLFFVFVFLVVGSAIKNSDAYKTAIEEIEKNEQVKTEIGTIISYGMIPSGNIITENEYGQALLEIKVIGENGTMPVTVYLEKGKSGHWQLVEMQKEDGTVLKSISH
ncbi:RDD family protein [Myroides fluvii]|uniref:RDD family protein n=1 Tax=Myroides fluvii TaxID=2572594 RepID=UPI00131E2CBD|nr:RDD family protein [Myroides fluvii]